MRAGPEAPVLKGAQQLLALRGFGLAWRNNTGRLKNEAGRPVAFGRPGSSDLMGVVPRSGRFLAVETKAPGGRPTKLQDEFLRAVCRSGGVAVLVEDVAAQLDPVLLKLRRDPWARIPYPSE